jgi:hypothetical protein
MQISFLKGFQRKKTRATGSKTTQNFFYGNRPKFLADYCEIGIRIRPNTIVNKRKSHNLESSSVQGSPTPQSSPKAAPQPKDECHRHRPVATVCRCRLMDQMPSFRHCKLQQGIKWKIATTSFLGSCDNSPCRHRHHARTNQPAYLP